MSTQVSDFDSFLDDIALDSGSSPGSYGMGSGDSSATSWHEPGYEGSIDYRIRQLSYSSLLTLHTCPPIVTGKQEKNRTPSRRIRNLHNHILFRPRRWRSYPTCAHSGNLLRTNRNEDVHNLARRSF